MPQTPEYTVRLRTPHEHQREKETPEPLTSAEAVSRGNIPSNPAGQLRDRVRELERERVTVQEAARRLGITESAVRKRVQRRLLEHDKEADGRLYVYLDTQDKDRDGVRDRSYDMLVRRLENENEFLRRELERKDTILLNMTEAMKALNPPAQEAPSEARESPETVVEEPERAEPRPASGEAQEGVKRPWWRRMFRN